jgi:pyrimidine operon attenuation protein/uracil phosphoribosyltransferase
MDEDVVRDVVVVAMSIIRRNQLISAAVVVQVGQVGHVVLEHAAHRVSVHVGEVKQIQCAHIRISDYSSDLARKNIQIY